ncbi:uncharacterized protein LOC141714251 [Apium graveolens]|uniref:uncharacterized protein LOC141714251 n=1 Tax=Apium graveolens TaxID=4045 RepID=UPI003D791D0A
MGVLLVVLLGAVTLGPSVTRITLAIILLVIYLFGILYLSFVWQLANVISVLEDVCEYQALVKSKNLIKGKTRICAAIYLINILCSLGIYLGFIASAVGVDSVWGKLLHLCVWSMIISVLYLFGLVIQTIIYFICKSYHHENIDKSSLANLLEVYRKDYVPLDTKEVHMQHSMV